MNPRHCVAVVVLALIGPTLRAQSPPPPVPHLAPPPEVSPGMFQATPGRPLSPFEAFRVKPNVVAIPEPGEVRTEPTPQGGAPVPTTEATVSLDARFDQPAFFPEPRFGLAGECVPGDGVVLYEGMLLRVKQDGHYEVAFTATTPATAVTLRLQLQIVGPTTSFTMTLPPIGFDPKTNFRGNLPVESFQVYHAGYSHHLAHNPHLPLCRVTRQGTARFGSWPEGINRYGILATPTTLRAGDSSNYRPDGE